MAGRGSPVPYSKRGRFGLGSPGSASGRGGRGPSFTMQSNPMQTNRGPGIPTVPRQSTEHVTAVDSLAAAGGVSSPPAPTSAAASSPAKRDSSVPIAPITPPPPPPGQPSSSVRPLSVTRKPFNNFDDDDDDASGTDAWKDRDSIDMHDIYGKKEYEDDSEEEEEEKDRDENDDLRAFSSRGNYIENVLLNDDIPEENSTRDAEEEDEDVAKGSFGARRRTCTPSERLAIELLTKDDDDDDEDRNTTTSKRISRPGSRRMASTKNSMRDTISHARRVSLFDTKQLGKMKMSVKELHLMRLCFDLLCWHMFWILYSLLIVAEMWLSTYNPYNYPSVRTTQEVILCVSFFMHSIQMLGHLYHHKIEVQSKLKGTKISYWESARSFKWNTPLILETYCLIIGMVFIWEHPGISLLRLFRTFRLLFYHDGKDGLPIAVLEPLVSTLSCITGRDYVILMMKVLKFASTSLQNMGREMFYLTAKSKGGFILVFMMLYSSFVIGITFWIEMFNTSTDASRDLCSGMYQCIFTMIGFLFSMVMVLISPTVFSFRIPVSLSS